MSTAATWAHVTALGSSRALHTACISPAPCWSGPGAAVRSCPRSGSGDRTRGGRLAGVDAEGDDASGLDADDGVLEPFAEGLASGRDHGGGPADLDHAGLPRREHVVD